MDDRVRPQREVPRLRRPWKRGGVGAEVAAVGTAAHAEVPRLARPAPLLEVDRVRLREVRPPPLHDVTVLVVRAHRVAEMLLDAVEVERRQVLAVGHRFETVAVAAHADELLDVRIPGCHVVVPDRPLDAVAHARRRGELVLAPPLARTPPDQRLSADLIAADPVERRLLHVRVVAILDEEVRRVLAVPGRLADERVLPELLPRHRTAMRKLPWLDVHGGIVLDVLHAAAALEDERLEALLAQLLRGPAAGDARADDDRVEGGGVGQRESELHAKRRRRRGLRRPSARIFARVAP